MMKHLEERRMSSGATSNCLRGRAEHYVIIVMFLLCSPSSVHITAAVFSLCSPLYAHILFASYISAQILYGTCNSTSNVINYDCHPFDFFLCFLDVVAKPTSIIAPEVSFLFLSKDFYSTTSSGGFSAKATIKSPCIGLYMGIFFLILLM